MDSDQVSRQIIMSPLIIVKGHISYKIGREHPAHCGLVLQAVLTLPIEHHRRHVSVSREVEALLYVEDSLCLLE